MEKFINFISSAVPMPINDVDTDQIIPARFLKATTREGFGENLFRDWRYDAQNQPKPDFVLNNPIYSGNILVAGSNFGSGSSREHAAWAIYDFGFRVVVSSYFADIFKNNALNNGLLPIQVTQGFLELMFREIATNPAARFEINLDTQTISSLTSETVEHFEIGAFRKTCLKEGYDTTDYLRSLQPEIAAFEMRRNF